MRKRKKLFGRIGLALVALMTIFAYNLPNQAAAVSDSHTDVIRVTVYDQYPAIRFISPEDGHVQSSPFFKFVFAYENSSYVKLTLKYYAIDQETGEEVLKEIPVEDFVPADLDETFDYASGTQEYDFNLATCKVGYNGAEYDIPNCVSTRSGGLRSLRSFRSPVDNEKLVYNHYYLHIASYSPVGYAEDEIEFYYTPAYLVQTGNDAETGDPEVEIYYDKTVAKLGLQFYDLKGNLINDEPVILENEDQENFEEGAQGMTLPFASYGLAAGDYIVKILSYDKDGAIMDAPWDEFRVTFTPPAAPVVPDTGSFLAGLNIAESDYVITSVIIFVGVVFIAFALLGRKKKDYRKNYRSRR